MFSFVLTYKYELTLMVRKSCLVTLGSARIYTLKMSYCHSSSFLAERASICKKQGFEARNDKPLSFLCGLTSKGQVGVLLGSTGGGCCTQLFHIKQKILCTTACFPVSPQRGINYPPTYVGPPFLSRKELRFANFLFVSICILSFYKRIVRFVPAIPLDCTVSRIRQDSCWLLVY